MGKKRRGKPKQSSSGSQRDGASCSTPVERRGGGGEAIPTAEGEGDGSGDGAAPQRKRQRVSREGNSQPTSAWRGAKENRSDAEGPVVDGVPNSMQECPPVQVACSGVVSSSQGSTAVDGSETSKAVSPNVSPIKSRTSLQLDLPTTRCDSDSDDDDDDDLPSVSISFGTPTHERLTFDSIMEGAVYWLAYPRYPPWPAVAVSKLNPKTRKVQALFFNDTNPDIKAYSIKIKSCTASLFSEVATERDKFMAEKVESHKRYPVFKRCIEAAVDDAKLYIARKDELSATLSPADLFDSITRRRITEEVHSEGEATPKFVRDLKFFSEESDSEGGSHNGEEESVGDKEEEEGSGRSARIVGVAAARGAPTDMLYSNQYCSRFLQRKAVKEALKGIMERRVPSKRHNTFFSGSNSERRVFRSSHLGPLERLNQAQRERVVEKLKGFVLQWKRETDVFPEIGYTFDVLLPETIIRMIADVEKVPLDAAEQKYCNWYCPVAEPPEEDE